MSRLWLKLKNFAKLYSMMRITEETKNNKSSQSRDATRVSAFRICIDGKYLLKRHA